MSPKKPKFRLNQHVKIISSQKNDGRYNRGIVVGTEGVPSRYYLGYLDEKSFFQRFKESYRYKVAYVDCVTRKATSAWFDEASLETVN